MEMMQNLPYSDVKLPQEKNEPNKVQMLSITDAYYQSVNHDIKNVGVTVQNIGREHLKDRK